MRAIARILRIMLRDQRVAFLRGAVLSVLVLLMGAGLLGVSGWLITAAAAAGMVGAGAVFDVFRPSATVRFLALGRTAARYGERMLTHDATLRALTNLRVHVLGALALAPFESQIRLRAAQALNRITADVDALDGAPLRLLLPVSAAGATLLAVWAALWMLVTPVIASTVVGIFALGGGVTLVVGCRATAAPAQRLEQATQRFRSGMVDLVTARSDLTVYGRLPAQTGLLQHAETERAAWAALRDRHERRAGLVLSLTGAIALAAALWLGAQAAMAGDITAARAAIGVFVSLALIEVIAPLRRAIAEYGRIAQAAARVVAVSDTPAPAPGQPLTAPAGAVRLDAVSFQRAQDAAPVLQGVSARFAPGTATALTGPSGCGKSTLLGLIAGLHAPTAGQVTLDGQAVCDLDRQALRAAVTLVPQRAALIEGSVAQNLRIGSPAADDAQLWAALEAVSLAGVIRGRGGLEAALGPRGAGLSGGESRRLVLARALLRAPVVLLLDEPTEGLDRATAQAVLRGVRAALPAATLVIAAHRDQEIAACDTRLDLV